jgi:putative membrane protein
MRYGGAVHIIVGALTMLAFGGYWIGWGRTLIFFGMAVPVSFVAELIGTSTGWPFGNYAYTDFLGYKIAGHVPFTIPLSWFYFGFAAYLLANTLITRFARRGRAALAVIVGAYLLTVWDLVLDPAMAHEEMTIRFWNWSESGVYVGMPLQNFVGWTLTAALSRLLWRQDLEPATYPIGLPSGIYLANMLFAIVLAASVGLWLPIILSSVLGILPVTLLWHARLPGPPVGRRGGVADTGRLRNSTTSP